jgi:tRNA dimethylallyltransferase
LEVYLASGQKFSEAGRAAPPSFAVHRIGLTLPREDLYRRVDQRVDEMIARGWLDEVRALVARYAEAVPALSSLGYPQMSAVLRGELTLDEAARDIKYHTHRFIRHQYAWFRPADPRLMWFDLLAHDAPAIVSKLDSAFVTR